MVLEVRVFLGGDHLPHELHGGIVLPAILRRFLRTYIHLVDLLGVRLQTYLQVIGRGSRHVDKL